MKDGAAYQIEKLLDYGLQKGLLEEIDRIPVRNKLFDILHIAAPYEGAVAEENWQTATGIMNELLNECVKRNIIANNVTERDLMDARIMGELMPRASETAGRFLDYYKESPCKATDYLYQLSRDSNYIQVDRIAKNQYWQTDTEYGRLEITINLSKPEKDPKEIAAAKQMPQTGYPKCLLCKENAGYPGHLNHPARQNLRLVPIMLAGERWYLQYSPYLYYAEHCIVLSPQHVPMKLTRDSFQRLFDFVQYIPHYFIGSNADLPIVGGSILTHDHFQGGRHEFPMAKAPIKAQLKHNQFPEITAGIVKWPLSVLRISAKRHDIDTRLMAQMAYGILEKWRQYSEPQADIMAATGDTPHNTITPIVRKNKEGCNEIDLVLRNNRTSEKYPDGIFHPHQQLHHIKKENIGLIEVMGLAILPGRLKKELEEIKAVLTGESPVLQASLMEKDHPLHMHRHWILDMVARYGDSCNGEQADYIIKEEVGMIFKQVLTDAGVFKDTDSGFEQFLKFTEVCGFELA